MKISIIGGTGKLGLGLAHRLTIKSYEIAIGSRDGQKAAEAASTVGRGVLGKTHDDAAVWCDVAIIAIPYFAHNSLLAGLSEKLAGKIVVDATVPLDPADPTRILTQSGTSAAAEASALLPESRIFGAFHTVSHRVLQKADVFQDVLVAGGDDEKTTVFDLIRSMNLRPIHAGPLVISEMLERMTALLISINKQNHVRDSGIRITGLPD